MALSIGKSYVVNQTITCGLWLHVGFHQSTLGQSAVGIERQSLAAVVTHEHASHTVGIVLVGTITIIVDIAEGCIQFCSHTHTTQIALGSNLHNHVYATVLQVVVGNLAISLVLAISVAEAVVLNPTVVLEGELGMVGLLSLGQNWQEHTLHKVYTIVCNGVACRSGERCFGINNSNVEHSMLSLLGSLLDILGVGDGDSGCLTGLHITKHGGNGLLHLAVEHNLSLHLHALERTEVVGIAQGESTLSILELDELMSKLHLCQLGSLATLGSYHTIRAEVALVRAGEVVTSVQTTNTLLQFQRFVDSLVHPVPDTATDSSVALLHTLHVLGQVADGITHSMSIFAKEHGFVHIAGVLCHPVHRGVHLGVEVGVGATTEVAVDTCSLVVYGTSTVHLVCSLVAILEVGTGTCLVTQ